MFQATCSKMKTRMCSRHVVFFNVLSNTCKRNLKLLCRQKFVILICFTYNFFEQFVKNQFFPIDLLVVSHIKSYKNRVHVNFDQIVGRERLVFNDEDRGGGSFLYLPLLSFSHICILCWLLAQKALEKHRDIQFCQFRAYIYQSPPYKNY
jgi:hypothetical protein